MLTCLAALTCCMAFAQGPDKKRDDEREKYFQQIENEKIAFFTMRLDLTPEEAQAFWPVYNTYSKEAASTHDEVMKALVQMKKKGLSEAETEALLNRYADNLIKEGEVVKNYIEKFKQILPIEKVSKIFIAENDFRMELMNRFKKSKPGVHSREAEPGTQRKERPNAENPQKSLE